MYWFLKCVFDPLYRAYLTIILTVQNTEQTSGFHVDQTGFALFLQMFFNPIEDVEGRGAAGLGLALFNPRPRVQTPAPCRAAFLRTDSDKQT